jgi:hypothetical protein
VVACANEAASGIAQDAKFYLHKRLVAFAFEGLSQQHFIVATAIKVCGIHERDASLHGCVDRSQAFGVIGRAVEIAHAHKAKAERGYVRTIAAKSAGFHVTISLSGALVGKRIVFL